MKKVVMVTAGIAVATLALAGCGTAPADADNKNAQSDYVPCLVAGEGGFDDKSFNQLSYEGLQSAALALDVDFKTVASLEGQYEADIESIVNEGCTTVVTVGFQLSPGTVSSATAHPGLDYMIVGDRADGDDQDNKPDAPNIKPVLYDTAQGSFLAGYLAAGYSKTGKVGTYGALDIPPVTVFMDGFRQGVDHYNKVNDADIDVIGWDGKKERFTLFTGSFNPDIKAKQAAVNLIDQGADVLLPVGAAIYQPAVPAIEDSEKDVVIIGVDADLYETDSSTRNVVLTSILKKVDVSISELVQQAGDGKYSTDPYIGDLKNGGVGIAPLHNFEGKVDPKLVAETETLQDAIIGGEVEVDSYLNEEKK